MSTFHLKFLQENYIFLRQNSFLDIFFPVGIEVRKEGNKVFKNEVYYKFSYSVTGYVINETNGTPELKFGCVNNIIDYSDILPDTRDEIEFGINRHYEKYLEHKEKFNFKHLFKYDNEQKNVNEIDKQIKLNGKIYHLCMLRAAYKEKN